MPQVSTGEFRLRLAELAEEYSGRCTAVELAGALGFLAVRIVNVSDKDDDADITDDAERVKELEASGHTERDLKEDLTYMTKERDELLAWQVDIRKERDALKSESAHLRKALTTISLIPLPRINARVGDIARAALKGETDD